MRISRSGSIVGSFVATCALFFLVWTFGIIPALASFIVGVVVYHIKGWPPVLAALCAYATLFLLTWCTIGVMTYRRYIRTG